MRRLKLRNLTICLCMICVVAFSVTTPIVRVSALADPVPELAPVFDTQIYQLKDYVDENIVDTPKEPIFYMLMGAYLVSQAGMNQYELIDPYTTKDGVVGWLKSTGIQLYNSLVDFIPYDPITGTDLKPLTTALVGYALGAAGLANKYTSETEFLNDIDNSDNYMLPFNKSIQLGINSVLQQNGGLFDWQNDIPYEFTSNFTYSKRELDGLLEDEYIEAVNTNTITPRHLCNRIVSNFYNCVASTFNGTDKFDLFIDTNDHTIKFQSNNLTTNIVGYNTNTGHIDTLYNVNISFPLVNYEPSWFSNYLEIVQYFFRRTSTMETSSERLMYGYYNYYFIFDPIPLLRDIYIGVDWDHRELFSPSMTLNFEDNNLSYYLELQTDYLVDIKGLLNDLLNVTNLYQPIIDNLYNTDGTIVLDPSLIQVNVNLPDSNPLPVNLNEISEIIDNTYLDIVKQRATQASETIGEYVAFWHNCDPEVVYVSLGAILIIAIGAFIGKWGHS